jgi:hypothetical protein
MLVGWQDHEIMLIQALFGSIDQVLSSSNNMLLK